MVKNCCEGKCREARKRLKEEEKEFLERIYSRPSTETAADDVK